MSNPFSGRTIKYEYFKVWHAKETVWFAWTMEKKVWHFQSKCLSRLAWNVKPYFQKKRKRKIISKYRLLKILSTIQSVSQSYVTLQYCNCVLTLILLNNLFSHTHFWLSTNQITSYKIFVQIHKLNGKQCRSWSDGFFRSHLIWIYTVCKGRGCREQQDKD